MFWGTWSYLRANIFCDASNNLNSTRKLKEKRMRVVVSEWVSWERKLEFSESASWNIYEMIFNSGNQMVREKCKGCVRDMI